ncbi:MAG: hypothetical protein H0V39_05140 [Nitrosomonas sp.]|jgi:hypothetical protein|nr:hypothetical protein [Nitrosomonas sp.]
MYCCIKEWPDKMATLMTEDGVVVWTFNSIEEAREVWHDWYQQQTHQSQQRMSSVTQRSIDVSELPIEIYAHPSSFSTWLKAVTESCHRYFSGSRGK